jgi:hypothetical protein
VAGVKDVIKRWLLPPGVHDALLTFISKEDSSGSGLSAPEKNLLKGNALLKDVHQRQRCFILGAGPSVRQQDITNLAGEIVLSVSNTFVHPDYASIQPRYHVLPPILSHHGQNLPVDNFVTWLKAMDLGTGDAELFFHIGDRLLIEDHSLFVDRTIHWLDYSSRWNGQFDLPLDLSSIPPVWSVSEVAISVALFLGFEKIYLLGFDHDWFNGLNNYFFDVHKDHAARPTENTLRQVDSEYQMRRHADIFKKYKYLYSIKGNIYNANANMDSYVDVFPKVKFEELFT